MTESGMLIPEGPVEEEAKGMVESQLMQYLMLSVLNPWARLGERWTGLWNRPEYGQLAAISAMTMRGIDVIKEVSNEPESKKWVVTSMMARGISLARLSCIAMATGSFSDTLSNYRMLLERELTLKHIGNNNEYENFHKSHFAELYQRANKGLNSKNLRKTYPKREEENSKRTMTLIRKEHFNNKPPKSPENYWKRPKIEDMVKEDEKDLEEMIRRLYDLGSQSVHPRARDMIQPEESDIPPEVIIPLIVTTLGQLSRFGLSQFAESSRLAERIEEIIVRQTISPSILEMLIAMQEEHDFYDVDSL